MRKVLFFALVLVLVLSLGGIAHAHISGFTVDGAVINQNGEVTDIFGRIRCTAGETFIIRVRVFQGTPENPEQNEAFGRASGTCTGETQFWDTGQVRSESGFTCDRPAAATGEARSFQGGNLHDAQRTSDRIEVFCPA